MVTKRLLLDCCQAWINSYRGRQGKEDWSRYDHYQSFVFGIDEGFFAVIGKMLFVVIQGTDEKREWESNFKIESKHLGTDKKIKVEQGFLEGYLAGRGFILNKIEELSTRFTIEEIIVTGHSRGAGIGTLIARDVRHKIDHLGMPWRGFQKVYCITGGSPRVYNYYGAKEFNKSGILSMRLIYRNDIVTRVPWNIMPFGGLYCHVSKAIYLGKPFILSPIGIPWDHYPQKYLEGVIKCQKF